jgi:peptidoglycan/LPS O-acetylase OafA/YrhL
LAKNAIASAFFNANLMLLSETGYFDVDANQKPPLQLSSLGIEEQFYLAWPLALWLTPHRLRRAMIAIVLTGSFALNVAFGAACGCTSGGCRRQECEAEGDVRRARINLRHCVLCL